MNELEELENYNKKNNEILSKRAVGNFLMCNKCHGSGIRYISPISDYEGINRRCYECHGKGYVNFTA